MVVSGGSYGGSYGGSFGGMPSLGSGEAQSEKNRREIVRQQGRNNGLDVEGIAQASGVEGYQESLPALDLQWLYQTQTQAFFALTIGSQRGGLNMQRDRIEKAHTRQSSSSLVAHARDELILAFKTDEQTDLQVAFSNYNILHCMFQDRMIMCPYLGDGTAMKLYAETSATDPTVVLAVTLGAGHIFSIGTARFNGTEYLILMTSVGTYILNSSFATVATIASFQTVVTPAETATFWSETVQVSGGSVTGFGWTGGHSATYEYVVGMSFVQSPLPGNPLIVRGVNSSILVPTEPSDDNASPYTQQASRMLTNIGLGNMQSLGFITVGNRQPRAYWWETNNGGPASQGDYHSRLTSLDAWGLKYQVHDLSISKITGSCAVRQRGAIALTDGYRAIYWTGREVDMALFSDEVPSTLYTLYCVGLYEKDGQVYAEINELPKPDATNAYGASIGQGRIRSCKRRYDFDLRRWHQISEWETLTEDGLIRWSNGVPIPVGDPTDLHYGFMSAYGAPDLPFAKTTQTMHNHMVPPRYSADLLHILPLPSASQFEATWTHKFEPPASQNPYSYIGSKDFASGGVSRTPGLIFSGEARYANKYMDEIYWGGADTGGTGTEVIFRIGEYNHLDDVNSVGDRPLLEHTFNANLSHAQRRRPFNTNNTALMIPQIETEIVQGSDTKLTPQALPFTVYGHIDLPYHDQRPAQEPRGRSKA